ncbi:hypothetical protein ISG24_37755, partial [Burkholderia pseudomallei]|nr:hypothetical protein [Burkholderia pseudomallei]
MTLRVLPRIASRVRLHVHVGIGVGIGIGVGVGVGAGIGMCARVPPGPRPGGHLTAGGVSNEWYGAG